MGIYERVIFIMKRIVITFVLYIASIYLFQNEVKAHSHSEHVNILLESPSQEKTFKQEISDKNLKIDYQVEEIGLYQLEGDAETINNLINNSHYIDEYNSSTVVTYNSMNKKDTKAVPYLWEYQWDIKQMTNNGALYDITEGSLNTTVAIIDSGISNNHIDLDGSVQSFKNFVPKGGVNNQEPLETGEIDFNQDFLGHGTFLAGQITANGYSKGVAPNIGVKSYRVFGSKGAETTWIIKAIIEAAKDDSDVINLSLIEYLSKGVVYDNEGNKTKVDQLEYKAYKKAIDFAMKKGSLVVASSGNHGLDLTNKNSIRDHWMDKNLGFKTHSPVYAMPSSLNKVVSVGSTNHNNEMSIFSNYGRNIVDIYAYGGDNRLIEKIGTEKYINDRLYEDEWIFGLTPDGGYTYTFGTSVSAAKVSGIAALIIDYYDIQNEPEKVREILMKSMDSSNTFSGENAVNIFN